MSTSSFNRRWAGLIIETLTRQGVGHFCIAPGSRSTPLTQAAAEHPRAICHTHFDERGLGHLALGLAKVSPRPVAIIVTSGTAVANLYPAIIEAGLTGERLIVLTADRPPELIDCGANQAIRQPGIFSSHPADSLNLPRPSEEIPARWLVSTLDDALNRLEGGALHINCPFAEPLYGPQDDSGLAWRNALGDWWQTDTPWLSGQQTRGTLTQADWPQWREKRGVVIAGKIAAEAGQPLAAWAATLGWPLLADIQSHTGQPLPGADIWLADPQAQACLREAQIVIQFGGHLTSKRLGQWQASCQPEQYWLVDPQPRRLDPAQHRGRRLISPIIHWLAAHPARPQPGWAPSLAALSERVMKNILARSDRFGEAQVAQRLPQLLADNGQLFVGNSLVIRLIDAFAQLPGGYPVYSQRGASGIDGLIASAAGVQRANGRRTLAVIGDTSALYDINSLALLRQVPGPFVLLVINNNGGQIFSLLPTPAAIRESFYTLPHNLNFKHAAALFELGYQQPESWESLQQAVSQAWQRDETTLIEISVPPTDGADCLRQLLAGVAET